MPVDLITLLPNIPFDSGTAINPSHWFNLLDKQTQQRISKEVNEGTTSPLSARDLLSAISKENAVITEETPSTPSTLKSLTKPNNGYNPFWMLLDDLRYFWKDGKEKVFSLKDQWSKWLKLTINEANSLLHRENRALALLGGDFKLS